MTERHEEEMDAGEQWRAIKKLSQERRADNRESSAELLAKYPELKIENRNGGAHLIVRKDSVVVDFWPGTGRWIDRAQRGVHMRGVFRLIKHLGLPCQ